MTHKPAKTGKPFQKAGTNPSDKAAKAAPKAPRRKLTHGSAG